MKFFTVLHHEIFFYVLEMKNNVRSCKKYNTNNADPLLSFPVKV